MKLQLKRSNVLQFGAAKEPTPEQMEYGELAVNYNEADPVVFIKDSANNIIRLTNMTVYWEEIQDKPDVFDANDGEINVNASTGLNVTGSNATANQATNTTRTFSVDTNWLKTWIGINIDAANDGLIKINGGNGIIASGSNATANQANTTTRTLTAKAASNKGLRVTSDGIEVIPGPGIQVGGSGTSVKAGTAISSDSTQGVSVRYGNGLLVSSNNLAVKASDGILVNSSGVEVKPDIGIQVTSSGVKVKPDIGIQVTSSGVKVKADNGIQVSSSGVKVKAANGIVVNSSGVGAKADSGYAIDVVSGGIRFGNNWSNIPNLPGA